MNFASPLSGFIVPDFAGPPADSFLPVPRPRDRLSATHLPFRTLPLDGILLGLCVSFAPFFGPRARGPLTPSFFLPTHPLLASHGGAGFGIHPHGSRALRGIDRRKWPARSRSSEYTPGNRRTSLSPSASVTCRSCASSHPT